MTVLVKFDADWADEFNVYGFKTFPTLDAWNDYWTTSVNGQSWYFGTNEGFEDDEIDHGDFTVTELTNEQLVVLLQLFPRGQWGHFPDA